MHDRVMHELAEWVIGTIMTFLVVGACLGAYVLACQ